MDANTSVSSRSRPSKRLKTVTSSEHPSQNVTPKPTKATRKKPSRLASLPGMPIDILFEIFGHLHPYDLLKLSRTTKDFRRLLTSKSAITVWKDSLSNVPGLPECPPGMSEIAWANLVFSPHCHFCLSVGTRNVEWAFRFRICAKCAKQHFEELSILLRQNGIYDMSVYSIFRNMLIQKREKRRRVCFKSDFNDVLKKYNSFSDDRMRKDCISDRTKSVETILEHAKRCQNWEQDQVQDRESELRQLREDRISAIKKKLIDLGWGKDLDGMRYHESLFTNKLANRPQRLTERIWTNIKPGILEHMEQVRVQRLKREYQQLVNQRKLLSLGVLRDFIKSNLGENLILPRPPDFWEFEPVKQITDMPADADVTLSSFDGVISQLPGLVNNWREQLDRSLVEILKKVVEWDNQKVLCYDENTEESYYRPPKKVFPNANLSEEELLQKARLASTVYKCRTCTSADDYDDDCVDPAGLYFPSYARRSQPLFYPHVLGHQCSSIYSYGWGWDMEFDNPRTRDTTMTYLKRLSVDTSATKPAESVIELAGLDPATATADGMDKLDLRFICNRCSKALTFVHPRDGPANSAPPEDCRRDMFDWRAAIRHQKDLHYSAEAPIFTKVKKNELDDEILQEESEHRLQNNCEWRCIHCIDQDFDNVPVSFDSIKRHFESRHSDLPFVENEGYIRDFAAPNICCTQPTFHVRSKDGHYSAYKADPNIQPIQEDSDSDDIDDMYY